MHAFLSRRALTRLTPARLYDVARRLGMRGRSINDPGRLIEAILAVAGDVCACEFAEILPGDPVVGLLFPAGPKVVLERILPPVLPLTEPPATVVRSSSVDDPETAPVLSLTTKRRTRARAVDDLASKDIDGPSNVAPPSARTDFVPTPVERGNHEPGPTPANASPHKGARRKPLTLAAEVASVLTGSTPTALEGDPPEIYESDHLILHARDPWWGHATWNLASRTIERLKVDVPGFQVGVSQFFLHCREFLRSNDRASIREWDVPVFSRSDNWNVDLGVPQRWYDLELCIRTLRGAKVTILRSNRVQTPPATMAPPILATEAVWAEPPAGCAAACLKVPRHQGQVAVMEALAAPLRRQATGESASPWASRPGDLPVVPGQGLPAENASAIAAEPCPDHSPCLDPTARGADSERGGKRPEAETETRAALFGGSSWPTSGALMGFPQVPADLGRSPGADGLFGGASDLRHQPPFGPSPSATGNSLRAEIIISGRTTPHSIITIGTTRVNADGDGVFLIRLPLPEGPTDLNLVGPAKEELGRVVVAVRSRDS
jgi:hypothetical protein